MVTRSALGFSGAGSSAASRRRHGDACGEAGSAQPRPALSQALHWVLHAGVRVSRVNMLAAEGLNSSCRQASGG
jgi:hypothetical protein